MIESFRVQKNQFSIDQTNDEMLSEDKKTALGGNSYGTTHAFWLEPLFPPDLVERRSFSLNIFCSRVHIGRIFLELAVTSGLEFDE